jgi:pantoate--beta-alanine ligase
MALKVYYSLSEFKEFRKSIDGKISVGFVPTMGALHQGHISLIEQAKKQCDLVICSIFVNPTQFNNPSDLQKYPRTLDADISLLKNAGTDILFAPEKEEMYAEKHFLTFDFGELERTMEGEFRPGHFNGVATIVSKLFHIVKPNFAFFGQKDLQQVAIIKDLTKALDFDLEIVRCPTIRNEKGLALSSRNSRLTAEELEQASILYQAQNAVIEALRSGKTVEESIINGTNFFQKTMNYAPEYLKVVWADTLKDYKNETANAELAVCIATPFGQVRLIDNIVFVL